jgi:hypothetical protein
MSWFSAARTRAAPPPGVPVPSSPEGIAGPASVAHGSLGFQALGRGLPEQPSILDLGPAIGANVRFFTDRARQLRIADLYATLLGAGSWPPPDAERLDQAMATALPFSEGERFDAVLAWDLFNYFRMDEIGAVMRRIRPFAAPGARLFALISFHKEIPGRPVTFRIQDEKTLIYGDSGGVSRPCPRYKLPDLERRMPGFAVEHSFLLRNGMQEYVLALKPEPPCW